MRKLRQQQLPIQREERSILYKSSMKQIFCYKAYCHLLMLLKALPALIDLYFFSPWPSLHEDWFISLWNSLHFLLHLLTVICGIHLVYHFYNRMEEMEKRLSFCHDQHISYNMHMFTHTHTCKQSSTHNGMKVPQNASAIQFKSSGFQSGPVAHCLLCHIHCRHKLLNSVDILGNPAESLTIALTF